MAYCRKCGHQIQDDAVYCGKCGSEQNASAPPQPVQYVDTTPTIQQVKASMDKPEHCSDDTNLYFDHSGSLITKFIIVIAVILALAIIVYLFMNHKIAELEELPRLYRSDAISKITTIRNLNLLFDILMIGALLWRCFLTSKNYLRITGDVINGECCRKVGFTTVAVQSLNMNRVRNVSVKNSNTLIITADTDYYFLIDNANRAGTILRSKFYK